MMERPKFLDSPYFVLDGKDGGWELKDGAPEDVRKEFEEYMRRREEDEREGRVS